MDDFNERRDAFIKEFGELRNKHQCDFFGMPAFVPNEDGRFDVVLSIDVVDLKSVAQPSPFIKH